MLSFRFLPYWPLFAFLLIVAGAASWLYLRYTTPIYEASATILIKDERKGVDDSKMMEFLNIYSSKKIVENEIEVIHSRTVMRAVVENLHLYAPVWHEDNIKRTSAYTSSPVMIEAKDPRNLKQVAKVSFTYYPTASKVMIGKKSYFLNHWVATDYGVLKFTENRNKINESRGPLSFSLIHPNNVAATLLGSLNVSPVSKLSTVIRLKFRDEVPKRAEDILNEITGEYIRAAMNDKNVLASNTLAFVEDRMKYLERGLDSIEKRIQHYKSKKGVVDLSTQGRLFLENVGNNDRTLSDIGVQLAVLDQVEKYVVAKDEKAGIVPSTLGVNDHILNQLLQKLHESELRYANLKQTVGENNTVLTSLRNEIEQLRPSILENIHNQRMSLQASKANLGVTNNTFTSILQTIPQKERELLEISRDQSIKNNVYAFLLQKREETALSYASTMPDSRIIDKAESVISPVGPRRSVIYFAALVCAMGLGIAVVISKELLSGKILFRADIESFTKIPVSSEIAHLKHAHDLAIDQPKSFIAEQFRQLRASIGLYEKTILKKKLLITSSIAGEGKSFVAANLALSLAGSGKRVVLLDMDLRSPKTSLVFGLSEGKGIAEYLQGELTINQITKKTNYDNLYVIPAGNAGINPTELLLIGDLQGLFASLENSFNYILIDTSPIDPVTDAYVLSEYCDKTLFVVRHGYTPKTMVQLLDENNKIKALRDLSIVFNGVKKRGFIHGRYGFGYGFGYEYLYKERSVKNVSPVFN